ncbi:ead/Ea22-like family protein [Klebsiella pneumoniae]|uniref:ead/Ea22-like family protein n=1 Tax=Klebsiella pneumoniae TaxID=573 RepID=UPI000E2C8C42|nr:ead/Ea22-like family protein [Klebsiella pneumoniae]SVY08770.1 Uncharacterised protein [Klebsiella pneumoniae]
MTDITELAKSLKAAANTTADAIDRLKAFPGDELIDLSQHQGEQVDIDITTLNEWYELSSPANVLALVEALEKAQGMEAYWKTQCRGITDHCEELQARIAELESRTVQLSPELYTIGELIRTQDNRITDQPMFVVFQKREIIGSDEHSPSRICWVWDGEEVSELRAKRLEALYQDGRDTRGYDRYAMQEVDEFVTACFTEHGCKDYLRQNGHNLRLPYIYACGSFRNNEYQLVRNWLAGIKVEAE